MFKTPLFALLCAVLCAWSAWAFELSGESMGNLQAELEAEVERESPSLIQHDSLDEEDLHKVNNFVSAPVDKLEDDLQRLRDGLKNAPGPSTLDLNPSLASTPSAHHHDEDDFSAVEMSSEDKPTLTPFEEMKASLKNNINGLDSNLKAVAQTVSNLAKTQTKFADVVNNGKMDIQTYELAAQHFTKGPKAPYRSNKARTAKDVIDCTACRFAWLKVEQEVGNAYSEKALYDSFVSTCASMQQSGIFFSPCNDMFAQVDDLIADYLNSHTVNQMCMNARMCR
eukprot:TRINITY_DN53057_c0_g1_i1.p1 TRINITY_DN53057_c0_g1~~TRINITY_DN53057_c0_g1_i1.p1  ORF type:complete len:282 (-),score=55.14 TRINITY_DN53057_c0_g1_i1:61-906(-)